MGTEPPGAARRGSSGTGLYQMALLQQMMKDRALQNALRTQQIQEKFASERATRQKESEALFAREVSQAGGIDPTKVSEVSGMFPRTGAATRGEFISQPLFEGEGAPFLRMPATPQTRTRIAGEEAEAARGRSKEEVDRLATARGVTGPALEAARAQVTGPKVTAPGAVPGILEKETEQAEKRALAVPVLAKAGSEATKAAADVANIPIARQIQELELTRKGLEVAQQANLIGRNTLEVKKLELENQNLGQRIGEANEKAVRQKLVNEAMNRYVQTRDKKFLEEALTHAGAEGAEKILATDLRKSTAFLQTADDQEKLLATFYESVRTNKPDLASSTVRALNTTALVRAQLAGHQEVDMHAVGTDPGWIRDSLRMGSTRVPTAVADRYLAGGLQPASAENLKWLLQIERPWLKGDIEGITTALRGWPNAPDTVKAEVLKQIVAPEAGRTPVPLTAPKVSTEPSALQVKPGGGTTPLEAAAQAGVKAVGKGVEATKEERTETATRRQHLDEITNRVSGGRYKTYMSAPAELQARVIREEQGG